jgi:hypothetical protein
VLVLLSFGLVLVATVLLVLGLLVGDGLGYIYLSIGLSALAAIVLLVAVRLTKPAVESKAGPAPLPEPLPETAPARAAAAERTAAKPADERRAAVEAAPAGGGTATLTRPRDEGEWLATDEEWEREHGEPEAAPDDIEFPIADYDELTVAEIVPLLPQLFTDEIDVVESRERATKARTQVLNALQDLRAKRHSGEAEEPAEETGEWEAEAPTAAPAAAAASGPAPLDGYDDLSAGQVVAMLGDLDDDTLRSVRDYEAATRGRRTIVANIDRRLGAPGAAPVAPERAPAPTRTQRTASSSTKKAPTTTTTKAAPAKKTAAPATRKASSTTTKKAAAATTKKAASSPAKKSTAKAPARSTTTTKKAAPAKKTAAPAKRSTAAKKTTAAKKAAPAKKSTAKKTAAKKSSR